MKQFVYEYHNVEDFRLFLNTDALFSVAKNSAISSLIQIYSPPIAPDLRKIIDESLLLMPDAVIIGASSVGEIANDSVHSFSTVIIFSFFTDTHLTPFSMDCKEGQEHSVGESLCRVITTGSDIKGILLLTTPMSLNAFELLAGLKQKINGHLIFGGGASEYSSDEPAWVLHHKRLIHSGIVAVSFSSKSLQISANIGSGWQPFGNTKKITDTDGLKVFSIDNEPAINVLQQYTGIINNTLFSENASIFALMLKRENQRISRIPMTKDQFGAIKFAADINLGETFRLAVGDPALMIQSSLTIAEAQKEFQPEGLFIFACGIRRMLLQVDSVRETQLFSQIASSGGFYTSGEIFRDPKDNLPSLLYNTSMLVVGLRENTGTNASEISLPLNNIESQQVPPPNNQYEQRHAKVVANLMQFIRVITNELEATNEQLLNLSITDKLTGIFNRVELDNVLTKEIDKSKRYNISVSVIILDIDNFKSINDNHGHIVGDTVLVDVAQILKNSVRSSDTVGRWGGEEFMIILPHTDANSASIFAERIRERIQNHDFAIVGHQTASFGVASCKSSDDILSFINKADAALYQAKKTGKNKVTISPQDIDQPTNTGFLHLDWKPEYECNHEMIDSQHKNLFIAGNAIINSFLEKHSDQQIQQQIDDLILELKSHFESEEKIFEQTAYPHISRHKTNHQALIAKANQLNNQFKQNKISVGELLGFIIHDTISEHLLKADKGFFEYLPKED